MKNKRQNIQVAIMVCFFSVLIYMQIHFSSEEHLFEVGSQIEAFLGISTTIEVTTMQSFITTICSGVFASTLVTFFFYVQEYQREKQIHLQSIIRINKEICKYYSEIPYIEYGDSSDFSKLARTYYYEYYDNKLLEELSKASEGYLKTIPKSARRVLKADVKNSLPKPKEEKKNELLSYIKAHINLEDKSIVPEDILGDIIKTLDYKIDKAVEAYKKTLLVDLSELTDIYEDFSVFYGYGIRTRHFLKKRICDTNIYPYLYLKKKDILVAQIKSVKNQTSLYSKLQAWMFVKEDNKSSTENAVKRICNLQQRAQTYIDKTFEMHDLEELKKYNKKELLSGLLTLQYVLFDTDKMEIRDTEGNELKKIHFSYNKFIYYIENLNRLLMFDIMDRYKFLNTSDFALKVDRYEKGSHVYSKTFSGEDINPNIYRL